MNCFFFWRILNFLKCTVNRNNRYWLDTNPHIFHEVHTQRPGKLNNWAGIFDDHLVGPFFLTPPHLNGEVHWQQLKAANNPILNDDRHWKYCSISKDSAPPHYIQPVCHYLDTRFPGRRIGRCVIELLPRSLDLSPLDFFLWDHLISKICYAQPQD